MPFGLRRNPVWRDSSNVKSVVSFLHRSAQQFGVDGEPTAGGDVFGVAFDEHVHEPDEDVAANGLVDVVAVEWRLFVAVVECQEHVVRVGAVAQDDSVVGQLSFARPSSRSA